jgi:ribose transport system ATP-binding protein
LSTLGRHSRGGWVDEGSERRTTAEFCRRLAVQRASVEQPVGELSGGNQQKIVIARWLAREARVYLFDEPTRGIDVAAREKVFEVLRDLAAAGKAVLVVSSELPELTALCDRILVMSAGRIAAEFRRGEWTEEKLTAAAFSGYLDGGRDGASAAAAPN